MASDFWQNWEPIERELHRVAAEVIRNPDKIRSLLSDVRQHCEALYPSYDARYKMSCADWLRRVSANRLMAALFVEDAQQQAAPNASSKPSDDRIIHSMGPDNDAHDGAMALPMEGTQGEETAGQLAPDEQVAFVLLKPIMWSIGLQLAAYYNIPDDRREDVVDNALLHAWMQMRRQMHRKAEGTFYGWLKTVISHKVLDATKKRGVSGSKEVAFEVLGDVTPDGANVHDLVEEREFLQALNEIVATLDDMSRDCLRLQVSKVPASIASKMLGLSPKDYTKCYTGAKRRVRALFKRRFPDLYAARVGDH